MAEKNNEAAGNGVSGLAVKIAEKANKIKYVLLAVFVLLIAGMVVSSQMRRQKTAREAEAEGRVFQAEVDLAANPESDVLAIFGKTAKEYEGLPAGARALIIKFAHAYNTREFAAAEDAAREFVRVYPKNILASRAKLALGQTLLDLNKPAEAEKIFRELIATADQEVFPEAKLGLAQTLERQAEAAKDNPEEYRRRLEAAEAEYNDIVARSQITVPSQRGFWPQSVTLPADFSLAIIRDRLAGHKHPAPLGSTKAPDAANTGVMATPPPPPEDAVKEEAGKSDAPAAVSEAPAAPPAEEEKGKTEEAEKKE